MAIYKSVSELIGKTPLLELCKLEKSLSLKARLLVKVECMNPAGSIKDRAAKKMLDDAESRGLIKEGAVIIEPTSGNTGIGLASVAAARGYRVIIVMPDTMSKERCHLMKAYGAELVLTDGKLGMSGAIAKARELAKEIDNSFIPDQFANEANAKAHYETTGPEIYADTNGDVDILIATVGTGGTITGIGRYLKNQNPEIKVIAVEPSSSPVLSGGKPGAHKIQGIGAGFVPQVLDTSVYDSVMTVTDEEAYVSARLIGKEEGLFVGISSGAALSCAIELAKLAENENKTIVAVLPDSGSRYLSVPDFVM